VARAPAIPWLKSSTRSPSKICIAGRSRRRARIVSWTGLASRRRLRACPRRHARSGAASIMHVFCSRAIRACAPLFVDQFPVVLLGSGVYAGCARSYRARASYTGIDSEPLSTRKSWEMPETLSRIVTGFDEDGKSVFVSDDPPPMTPYGAEYGSNSEIWA